MKLITYIFFNGILAASLYFGFFENVEGAKNIAYFMAWMNFITSLVYLNDEAIKEFVKKKHSRTMPVFIDVTLDIVVTAVFLWFGAFMTATVYVLHVIFSNAGWSKIEEGIKNKCK